MLTQGFVLSSRESYVTLINGLCRIGETNRTMELLREMEAESIIYNMIMDNLCKSGRIRCGYAMIVTLFKKGEVSKTEKFLNEMRDMIIRDQI